MRYFVLVMIFVHISIILNILWSGLRITWIREIFGILLLMPIMLQLISSISFTILIIKIALKVLYHWAFPKEFLLFITSIKQFIVLIEGILVLWRMLAWREPWIAVIYGFWIWSIIMLLICSGWQKQLHYWRRWALWRARWLFNEKVVAFALLAAKVGSIFNLSSHLIDKVLQPVFTHEII